jgi:hypothetical protein
LTSFNELDYRQKNDSGATGGLLDPDKRQALSDFYREEFQRHLEQLQSSGILNDSNPAVNRACRKLLSDLDLICGRERFSAVAENLLRNFDALTRLSELDPRRGH